MSDAYELFREIDPDGPRGEIPDLPEHDLELSDFIDLDGERRP
jgi:hypothetical protein